MTAAFNLAQLANNLNTSGQLDATDGLTGLVANANLASSGTASSSTFLRGDRTWASVPQKLLQTVVSTTTTSTSYAYTSGWTSDLITATITANSTSNRIIVQFNLNGYMQLKSGAGDAPQYYRITRNGSVLAYYWGGNLSGNANAAYFMPSFSYIDTPPNTTAQTYAIQFGGRNDGDYWTLFVNSMPSTYRGNLQNMQTSMNCLEVAI